MKQKKSIQLSQAFGAVLSIVLVAVLVIVAIVIFVNLATGFEGTQTSSITNESMAIDPATDLSSTAFGAGQCGFTTWTPGLVLNATTNATLVEGVDYSVQSAAGTLTNLTLVASPLQVSYDYNWGSGACDASENLTTEFGNYTSLIGLVGTIIFLGLVIGVLVTSFAFGGRREV